MGRKAKEINPKTDTGTAVATMEQDRLPARGGGEQAGGHHHFLGPHQIEQAVRGVR